MFRFGYMVSGKGRLLQTVINSLVVLNLPFELAVVIADRENEAVLRARRAGIRAVVVDYNSFPDRESFNQSLYAELKKVGVDGIMLNFDRLVNKDLCELVAGQILNTHFSLLPLFPGFGAIKKAAASGMRFSGVTIHKVDETVDGGSIVAQAAVPMEPGISELELGRRLFDVAVPMQLQSMSRLAEGRIATDTRYALGSFSPALAPPFDRLPSAVLDGI